MGQPGPGLAFRLGGFPVRIDWSFLLIAALLALGGGASLTFSALWISVVAVSVLVHELGHAVVARRLGATPSITLYALGGLTTFVPPRPLSRWESVAVSFAGPGAGFAAGLIVLGLAHLTSPESGTVAADAARMAVFVNLGWGFINLVPVRPLDGGAIVESLLPGDPTERRHRAAMVSVVAGGAAAIACLYYGLVFGAILLGMITASNLSEVTGGRSARRDDRVIGAIERVRHGDRSAVPEVARHLASEPDRNRRRVLATAVADLLIGQGDLDTCRRFSAALPGDIDPAVGHLLAALDGDPGALDRLGARFTEHPDPLATRCLVRGLVAAGRAAEIAPTLAAGPAEGRRLASLRDAHLVVHLAGQPAAAAAVGELLLREHPGAEATTWFNVACSHARAGHAHRALELLGVAVDRGWSDPALLDTDADLDAVRGLPEFRRLRDRLAAGTT